MRASIKTMLEGLRDITEFDVWKLCDEVRRVLRPILKRDCFRRDLELQDQLVRASERPCPNLAEGFSRYHPLEFAKFTRIAKSSMSEVIAHLDNAMYQGFVTEDEVRSITSLCRRARGAATGLIRYLETAEAPGVPRTRPRKMKRQRWPK